MTFELKRRLCAAALCLVMTCAVFAGCSKTDKETEEIKPAAFGTYGCELARDLSHKYPGRKAYSAEEASAAEYIKAEFEKLGYSVDTQTFKGRGGNSQNLIVHIGGDGFTAVEEGTSIKTGDIRRRAVIGAHYDSFYSASEIPSDRSYDAISDNASGIGCLLTVAKQIREYQDIGFDVDIVAFGASTDNYAGARAYFNSLSEEERAEIEVMFCIENIYAGDKVYANSGLNSLKLDQKYKMRRKLYQAYDVAYNDMLYSINGFNLNYNESGIVADINGDGVEDVYREVSVNRSDYSVFDEHDIPVVFFDSGDYFFDSLDKMKQTKNLYLQEFGGIISDTYLDSSAVLDEYLVTDEKDPLEIRTNNIAYVILGTLEKGSDYGLTKAQYEEALQKAKATVTPVA